MLVQLKRILLIIQFIIIIFTFSVKPASALTCKEEDLVCTERGGERNVNGLKVHRDCWKYSYNKKCTIPSKNDCNKIPAETCQFVEERCLQQSNEEDLKGCLNSQKDFSCEKTITYEDSKSELLVTGDSKVSSKDLLCNLLCIDGKCDAVNKAKEEANKELGSAIGQLAALAKIKDGVIDEKNLKFDVFAGQARSCSKKITNYTNCCSIGGWAESIGLAQCSSDDKQLAQVRKQSKCVSVGNYCSASFLGLCTIKKEVFCCYDSIISKTIQTGGRIQLNKSFGTPENPVCNGFTVEELQKIDFDKINYKEFYDKELIPRLKPVSQDALSKQIQNDAFQNIEAGKGEYKGFNQDTLKKYKGGGL